jgi:hypothetical protein
MTDAQFQALMKGLGIIAGGLMSCIVMLLILTTIVMFK